MIGNFQDGANLWFFKPNGLNRGRGIKIFSRVEELEQLIADSLRPIDDKQAMRNKSCASGKEINRRIEKLVKSYQPNTVKPEKKSKKTFIVQKYIEKPLLISGRKFDIRVWSLVTHELDFFFFRFLWPFPIKTLLIVITVLLGKGISGPAARNSHWSPWITTTCI